jgi:dolichol-phosphate mannosyltransferase
MNALVIIPTYNEIESLPIIIKRIFDNAPNVNILVVDDNSPDKTGEWAENERSKNNENRLFVLHQKGKMGLGTAYVNGFKWGIKNNYDILCEMDADGSHDAKYLPNLIDLVQNENVSLAIGSRWVKGGSVENWPKSREILSRAGNFYIKLMMNLRVHDATAGFRAYNVNVLKKIDLDNIESKGFSFQIDMTNRVNKVGAKIVETPIRFLEREKGTSKMSSFIIFEALKYVTVQGIKGRFTSSN